MDHRDFGGHAVQAAHQQSDFLHRGVGGMDRLGQRSHVDTARRSHRVSNSSRSWETTTMAAPFRARSNRAWWMAAAAPASTPQVGWATTSTSGCLEDFAADDVFLEIAARQAAGGAVGPARLDAEFLMISLGVFPRGVVFDPALHRPVPCRSRAREQGIVGEASCRGPPRGRCALRERSTGRACAGARRRVADAACRRSDR